MLFVVFTSLLAAALSPQYVLAKRVPMGHPSLSVTLYAGSDPRFDFFIVENSKAIETIKNDIDAKLYGIFDMIILPEIKKEFDERRNIYSDSYVEDIRGHLDMNDSTLDILIGKVPAEYGCNEESCAHRKVSVDVPSELRLSYISRIGFSIAVYEEMDRDTGYDQLVERILMKATIESKFLFSEGANVLEENKEMLLKEGTFIEHILLRQYEDISRISVLFLPFEPGVSSSGKKPLDVVITSNSYYERYWSSHVTEDGQGQEPSQEMLQECEELGIEETECSDVAILQKRPHQPAIDKDAIEQRDNAITSSLALIGMGAAGAGTLAVVVIRKLK